MKVKVSPELSVLNFFSQKNALKKENLINLIQEYVKEKKINDVDETMALN